MLATAKEEPHIGPGLDFIPDWHQENLPFSGENAVELPDDNNGNLTQKTNNSTSAFTLYEYDAENTLIRVVREDGSIVNYEYDGLGRRIEKEVDSVVTQYIYDNEDILLELDGSNNIVARYTHGPRNDEPLIMEKGGASFFYHADSLGTVTAMTDAGGTVAQSYSYSSFGKIEFQLDPSFVQPYTFTAREFDTEVGLYFYRERNYDPSTGRFLQEDPITFDGGINFYQFVSNNPVNFVDPFGLASGRLPGTNIPFRIDTNQAGGPNMHVKWPNNTETIITDKGKWLKTHGGQSLVKPPKKYRRALRKIVKKLKRFASNKYNVAGFLVSGFLEDLDILMEALECGRSFPRQAQRRIQELGNPEIIFSGGIPIPNPYHRPGADII